MASILQSAQERRIKVAEGDDRGDWKGDRYELDLKGFSLLRTRTNRRWCSDCFIWVYVSEAFECPLCGHKIP